MCPCDAQDLEPGRVIHTRQGCGGPHGGTTPGDTCFPPSGHRSDREVPRGMRRPVGQVGSGDSAARSSLGSQGQPEMARGWSSPKPTLQQSPAHASTTTSEPWPGGGSTWSSLGVASEGPRRPWGGGGEPQGCSATTNPLWGCKGCFVCDFLLPSEMKMPETVLVRSQIL